MSRTSLEIRHPARPSSPAARGRGAPGGRAARIALTIVASMLIGGLAAALMRVSASL